MQSVPAPHLLTRRRRPLLLAAMLAALVAAGVLAWALASSRDPAPKPAHPARHAAYNGLIGGVPLQQARCAQWNSGTPAERDRVSGALAYSVGGSTPYGRGTTLSTSETHTLFQNACASPIAQNWLLYELYIRAAGFHSYAPAD